MESGGSLIICRTNKNPFSFPLHGKLFYVLDYKKTWHSGQEWKRETKTEIKENSKFLLQILVTIDEAVHLCAPTVELRWQSRQILREGLMGILVLLLLTENTIVGCGHHP